MGRVQFDREAVLNRWARGDFARAIQSALGIPSVRTVRSIIRRAEKKNDLRAAHHPFRAPRMPSKSPQSPSSYP
jgi:hypothetical protein